MPRACRLGIFELPDHPVEAWEVDTLPADWAAFPYPASTQTLGSEWLRAGDTLTLRVPSCAVAGGLENIAVLNPAHPQVRGIQLVDTRDVLFNPRAFHGR